MTKTEMLINRSAGAGRMKYDPNTYCRDCKRSIHGEYADCDINIENNGRYVKGDHPCYCKIGSDGKMAEKYPWERREENE